jgi:hypothetical protein
MTHCSRIPKNPAASLEAMTQCSRIPKNPAAWPGAMKHTILFAILLAVPLAAKNTCADCHSDQGGAFQNDVHAKHGFDCASCHGGDPNADDPTAAMSKAKGFIGKPARTAVPKLCARCHSDAMMMHRFKPQQRVDQLELYQTSVHGKRLAAGDTAVANCVDCHSVHDIREVKDALSPVHPLRLPATCARCHADAAHMARYKIPTDQFAQYQKSVHWAAVAKRGDLSAPTCASCHGNHGAAPPQVASVAEVCGTCHVVMENLYNKSPHKPVFANMGGGGCTVCHGNHEIRKPGEGMLAGSGAVCSQCHDPESTGGKTAAQMAAVIGKLQSELNRADAILTHARNSGMEVSEAQMRQLEGREALVKAQVAVHSFRLADVEKPAKEGLAIAAEGVTAGREALRERGTRRLGLGIFLITALITIAGLKMAIRSIEADPPEADKPAWR